MAIPHKNVNILRIFKGYLRYKIITSENIFFEAQFKKFYFMEKSCSVLEIFFIFIF